ncbi:MAG: CehA/McbA family metallohydrolase [Planctomycetota bacterium]|nr:CehA/McbA family metallohydrolase [Planctomycetota bacterium]
MCISSITSRLARILSTSLLFGIATNASIRTSCADPPMHNIRVNLRGDGAAVPAAARIRILATDEQEYAPEGSAVRKTKTDESYFYADGSFNVSLPTGSAHLVVSGGLEYMPQTVPLNVTADAELTIEMQPWINMASRGWYSGDSHVHLHTGGKIGVTIDDALVAARAEGVNYVNLCVSNNIGDDIRDADLITGTPHPLSTNRHLLVFGEEMRSSIYGHMQFFGISKLVEPQYTGFDDTPNFHDFPANFVLAEQAIQQGGIVTYAHPMFKGQHWPFTDDLTAGNGAARELPIDAILNLVQAVDVMSYNSDKEVSVELWYRLLNCGLKLSACVGTDALLDQSTEPLGGSRVYVKTNGPLTMKSWMDGLAAGRSFATNGPILNLEVEGTEPGGTLSAVAGKIRVAVEVESVVPFNHVEVLVNGKVAYEERVTQNSESVSVRTRRFEKNISIERSSWVALRVRGPDYPSVFDGPVWAHTSPVYVLVDGQAVKSVEDAKYFVEWIDHLLRVVAARNRFAFPEDRQQVEKRFLEAQEIFRRMAQLQ